MSIVRHLIASFFLVGVDGLATSQTGLLRLTPFRSARRWGPYKVLLRNELQRNFFCFYMLLSTNKFVPKHIKTKDVDCSTSHCFVFPCGS